MNFQDKLIFKIALALVFVISTGFGLFGAGQLFNTILKDIVLQVENCQYVSTPIDRNNPVEPEKLCKRDFNDTKRSIADGLAGLVIGGGVSVFTYKKLRNLEEK